MLKSDKSNIAENRHFTAQQGEYNHEIWTIQAHQVWKYEKWIPLCTAESIQYPENSKGYVYQVIVIMHILYLKSNRKSGDACNTSPGGAGQ